MERYLPSAIILGTKRSGTNFTHDVLSYFYDSVVQEPLGLHNEGPISFDRNPVTYPEMTERPFELFQDLCAFLGLPWHDGMYRVVAEHTTTTGEDHTHGTFRKKTDIHSYKDTLTAEEIADIGSIFAESGIRLEKPSSYTISPK